MAKKTAHTDLTAMALSHNETVAVMILSALPDKALYTVVREAVAKRFADCAHDPDRRDELVRFCRGLITA